MPLVHTKPDMKSLPGGWEPTFCVELEGHRSVISETIFPNSGYLLKDVLSASDCKNLITFMASSGLEVPVSVHGRKDLPDLGMGSVRTTAWSESLANRLWHLIKPYIPSRHMLDSTSTDWWQEGFHRDWEPYGISPLLRFMRYENGGEHYSHYDAGFIYPDPDFRTLMSIVIYLTTNSCGGATRFIDDKQEHLPVWERSHHDWSRRAVDSEVIKAISPQSGAILLFDHRICHDVEFYSGSESRIIIRADLIFRRIETSAL